MGNKELTEQLQAAFAAWLEGNKALVGDKWYRQLSKEAKKAKIYNSMTNTLWMPNMASNLGVIADVDLDC